MRTVVLHQLTIGPSNAVAVRMRAKTMWLCMVMTRRRRRPVMIGAKRPIQREGKDCDDRQSGRETIGQTVDQTDHPGHRSMLQSYNI